MTEKENTWLPNLVGGVSIWKLAVDLNEPKFFDGRLLVPETEGSESLPVTVRWDLTGLTPLDEARGKWPEEVGAAVRDFQSALDRVAKVFSTPNSGFDKYKQAFTVPALDAEGSSNYFYSADKKKLYVINWGASPRSMGGKAEYVFGFQDWGKVFDHSAALSSAPSLAVANATGENPVVTAQDAKKKDDEKKKDEDEKKKDEKERAWWLWPLFALIAIALILLALFLVRGCEDEKNMANDAAADALADGASANEAGADAAGEAAADAMSDAAADALADGGDASADAMAEAAADAASDAGKDGGKDGGLAFDDEEDDDPAGGGGGGGSSGGGGGKVIVKTFPGGGTGPNAGARTTVHRRHYSEDAVAWRITAGTEKVARSEERGHRYDVWLAPGKTFEGVKVEWQDKAGKWHAH